MSRLGIKLLRCALSQCGQGGGINFIFHNFVRTADVFHGWPL